MDAGEYVCTVVTNGFPTVMSEEAKLVVKGKVFSVSRDSANNKQTVLLSKSLCSAFKLNLSF